MKKGNRIFVFDKELPQFIRFALKLLMPFFDIYHYFLLIMANLKQKRSINVNKRYYISICAVFKDENLSLKEWIEYHINIGIEHFYLYNNFSTDNYYEILRPYIEKGFVDLIDWPKKPPCQFTAYENCYSNFKNNSEWIAFIDLDEYICPFYENSLKVWLNKYENYPSVLIYWKMFGTSGLLEHDNQKLITEQYTICWEKYYDIGKCFFNTKFEVYKFNQHHVLSANLKIFNRSFIIPPINEFKKFVKFKNNRIGIFNGVNDFTIQINHYVSMAYVSCIKEKYLSRGDVNNHPRNSFTFFWHEHQNTSSDFKIWRFMIELKVRMGFADHMPEIIEFTKSREIINKQ